MRSLFLSVALGIGALGLIAATPSRADASWLSRAVHARYGPYYGASYYGGYYPYAYASPGYGYYSYGYAYPSFSYSYYRPYYWGGWHSHRGYWVGHHGGYRGGWHGGYHGGWHGGHHHHR